MRAGFDLDAVIRKVPDFPRKGILFYDITGILVHPEAYAWCIRRMGELYDKKPLDAVAGVEARGFLFAAPYAYARGLPLVLVRKKGRLPGATYRAVFQLEYGEDCVEVHRSDVRTGMKVLLVDDLIATGGTLRAASGLIVQAGAKVTEIFGVVGLPFLNYSRALAGIPVTTLLEYHGE
jgi:adenine phosphoribosyltransferase